MNRKLIVILGITVLASVALGLVLVKVLLPAAAKRELLLVYKVDLATALNDKLVMVAGDLEDELARKKIAGSVRRTGEAVVLEFNERASVAPFKRWLLKTFAMLSVTEPAPNQLRVSFLKDYRAEQAEITLRQAVQVVRQRIVPFFNDAGLYAKNGDELHLELPAMSAAELATVKKSLSRAGALEFRRVDDESPLIRSIIEGGKELPAGVSVKRDSYDGKHLGTVNYTTLVSTDLAALQRLFAGLPAGSKVPLNREILFGKIFSTDDSGSTGPLFETYLVHRRAGVTGSHIHEAEVQWDERTGRPEIGVFFDKQGAELFTRLSEQCIGRRLAIILDGTVNSAPVVQDRITGGRVRITLGGFRDPLALQNDAKDLVGVLRTGVLPARLVLIKETKL